MLLNKLRAYDIMDRENLDGLIAQLPINVYYLSDYWGLFNTPGGYDGAYFAILPRKENEPASLVVPALEIRRTETKGTWVQNIVGFSTPAGDDLLPEGVPKGTDYEGWSFQEGANLTDIERRWQTITARLGSQMSPDAFWAVTRALKQTGLEKARIATDEPRLQGWLDACGLTQIQCEYRVDLFNEIRLVKTEAELGLMRQAAIANEQALITAAESMQEGNTWAEIENIYMATMAQQSARGVYLMCGVGELPAGHIRKGEPVMFDALGRFEHYHGDFGRCAVVGEPSAELLKRHAAICKGWEAARSWLKPGVRYSELSEAVGEVVRKEGIANFRNPVVHSLGLEHTDDPKAPGVQPQDKPDQILQKGMVVNVDLPHTEIGWGSVHMEDTVVITQDSYDRLSTADFSIRTS